MKENSASSDYKRNALVVAVVLFITIVIAVIALLISGRGASSEQATQERKVERLQQEVLRLQQEIHTAEQGRLE